MEILQEGTVYALDKSPHALWKLKASPGIDLHIVEGDFNRPMELPDVDGIVMANALHYAEEPLVALQNVTSYLKPGGRLILIEYDTETPRPPWVPFPISYQDFIDLCQTADLLNPVLIGSVPSRYGYERIYSVISRKSTG
jgi:SAM-dependent methyltransferase